MKKRYMKKIKILIVGMFMLRTMVCTAQHIDQSYLEPDSGDLLVSIYLLNNDMRVVKKGYKDHELDSMSQLKRRRAEGKFNYFAFRITVNTIYYYDRKKSLVGNFVSYFATGDTIQFVMTEKNGDILTIEISHLDQQKQSVVITEQKLNGKIRKYYSSNCKLERRSR